LSEAKLPSIRFHDLRHSAATLLLSMGVHPKIVQEILGHSNVNITLNVYSHVLPSMQKGAIDMLNSAFEEKEGGISFNENEDLDHEN
jgi:integrase